MNGPVLLGPLTAILLGAQPATIFVAGDSTAAATHTPEDQQGWAEPFADYFDKTKVKIVNRARGGRSSRTFISEGLWAELVAEVKPGDVVLIQFGHNDAGAINEEPPGSTRPLRARASLPGLGEETAEIDNVLTKKHEVVHTYGFYMRQMIAETKAKSATPIVLSLTVRNEWKDGKVERGSGRYGEWSKALAAAAGWCSSTSPTWWPIVSRRSARRRSRPSTRTITRTSTCAVRTCRRGRS